MSDDRQQITELLETYFDGLYECDTQKLGAAFHPACHLYASDGSALVDWDRSLWFEKIAARESSKSQGHQRVGRILEIDQADGNTAAARVETAVQPRYFTDYLTLLKIDGKWQIIAKSYSFVVRDD